MTQGVVVGGWNFVWAAYSLTAACFLIYGFSLFKRLKETKND